DADRRCDDAHSPRGGSESRARDRGVDVGHPGPNDGGAALSVAHAAHVLARGADAGDDRRVRRAVVQPLAAPTGDRRSHRAWRDAGRDRADGHARDDDARGSRIVVGLGASFALTRVLGRFLFQITATDPTTFAFVVVGLAVVALAAAAIPARRASRIDPSVLTRAPG